MSGQEREEIIMGVLTNLDHEFWATISGGDLDDLIRQQEDTWRWGVAAVELRADLIPVPIFDEVLARRNWRGPTFVAHFGTGSEADAAYEALSKSVAAGVHGLICHSRTEVLQDLRRLCNESGSSFASAYHSQTPMTLQEALTEFEEQEKHEPLFRKIAVRAMSINDAVAIVQATQFASQDGGTPVVGAIFGPQRWARVALPHAGSAISFLIAHRVNNEVGGDDEQLQLAEANHLQSVRALYPTARAVTPVAAAG
jgi:3-dehydroquinate dehydratase